MLKRRLRSSSITEFSAAHGVHPVTTWRALKAGRLEYVIVGKRKLVVWPEAQRDGTSKETAEDAE
jgi:hypothetical protein